MTEEKEKVEKKETETKSMDVLNGKQINAWLYDGDLNISFFGCSIYIPQEYVEETLEELHKLKSEVKKASKAKRPRKNTKTKEKVKAESTVSWQKDVEDILGKEDKDNDILDEGTRRYQEYIVNGDKCPNPPEGILNFLNEYWWDAVIECSLFDIAVDAFQLGQLYQEHRKELGGDLEGGAV